MAELVDAADLKSADYYNLKGSSPFIPKATTHLDKSVLEEKTKKKVTARVSNRRLVLPLVQFFIEGYTFNGFMSSVILSVES